MNLYIYFSCIHFIVVVCISAAYAIILLPCHPSTIIAVQVSVMCYFFSCFIFYWCFLFVSDRRKTVLRLHLKSSSHDFCFQHDYLPLVPKLLMRICYILVSSLFASSTLLICVCVLAAWPIRSWIFLRSPLSSLHTFALFFAVIACVRFFTFVWVFISVFLTISNFSFEFDFPCRQRNCFSALRKSQFAPLRK